MDEASVEMQPQAQSEPKVPRPLMVLGLALVLAGVSVCAFIVKALFSAFRSGGETAFTTFATERLAGSELAHYGDEALVITQQGATVAAFIMFAVLALVAAVVALGLIQYGAQLIVPKFQRRISQMEEHMKAIRKSMAKYDQKRRWERE